MMCCMQRRNGHYRHLVLCGWAFIALAFLFCASRVAQENAEALKNNPARKLESYHFNASTQLIDRLKPIPSFLLEEIKKMDGRDDYRNYTFSPEEKKELAHYLELLPPRYKDVMRKRLIGIYAVSPFMGAGLTDWVMDAKGEVYAIMVINPGVMKKNISEWLTYREKSCFNDDGSGLEVRVDVGVRYSALMYFLLHETAHVVDYVEYHTPYVELSLKAVSAYSARDKLFVRGIWDEYAKPDRDADFPLRSEITFYGLSNGPKIPLSKAKELYNAFSKSPFVSLYASQNWAEDFAETAMVYHITRKLHQPYRILVHRKGKILYQYYPDKSEKKEQRFKYFASFY